jgi:hypothetical protein
VSGDTAGLVLVNGASGNLGETDSRTCSWPPEGGDTKLAFENVRTAPRPDCLRQLIGENQAVGVEAFRLLEVCFQAALCPR